MIALIESLHPDIAKQQAQKSIRYGGIAIFPVIVLALLFSLFHLGKPLHAFKAIFNLGNAMLSLEILAFIIIGALALVYSYMWWKAPDNRLRRPIGWMLSIAGFIGIVISANVYTLPARLAWDSWETVAAFLTTTILLGSVTVASLLAGVEEQQKAQRTLGIVVLAGVVGSVAILAGIASMYGDSPEQSAFVVGTFASGMFFMRLLGSLALPAAAAVSLFGKQPSKALLKVTLVAVVLGELIGRILFYSATMGQAPWF